MTIIHGSNQDRLEHQLHFKVLMISKILAHNLAQWVLKLKLSSRKFNMIHYWNNMMLYKLAYLINLLHLQLQLKIFQALLLWEHLIQMEVMSLPHLQLHLLHHPQLQFSLLLHGALLLLHQLRFHHQWR